MDGRGFDELTKKLAIAASRRKFFKGLLGGGAAAAAAAAATRVDSSLGAPAPKVDICHYQAGRGVWKVINISSNAVPGHVGHGDPPVGTACCTPARCCSNANCPAGQACVNGTCQGACVPQTCADLGKACGTPGDGCGGTATGCVECTAFANSFCAAGQCDCLADTCADLDQECGTPDDGCGGTATGCVECTAFDTCTPAACVSGACNAVSACTGLNVCCTSGACKLPNGKPCGVAGDCCSNKCSGNPKTCKA